MNNPIEFSDVFVAGTDGIHTYRIPSLLVSPAGDLLAFCEARKDSRRDDAPKDIVVKRSADGGRSWSPSTVAVAADLLLCTHLHSQGRGGADRNNLTLHLSTDGGRSWPVAHTLHPGPAAYSCPATLPDGSIGVLYECGNDDRYERLRFRRLTVTTDGVSPA